MIFSVVVVNNNKTTKSHISFVYPSRDFATFQHRLYKFVSLSKSNKISTTINITLTTFSATNQKNYFRRR